MCYRRVHFVEIVMVLWVILWLPTPCVGCLTMFDKTCLNRLARASNIKCLVTKQGLMMFGHQTFPVSPRLKMYIVHKKNLRQNYYRKRPKLWVGTYGDPWNYRNYCEIVQGLHEGAAEHSCLKISYT